MQVSSCPGGTASNNTLCDVIIKGMEIITVGHTCEPSIDRPAFVARCMVEANFPCADHE